jgi:hypothetical protein
MPFVSRRIDAKVLTNACGFALTLQKRRHQDSSACPLCKQPGEDRDHLLTCTHKRAEKQFDESIKPQQELLKDYKTEETIAVAIVVISRKQRKKQQIRVPESDLGIVMRHQEECLSRIRE